jgi:small subunit ribosomal protein S3
MGQKVHPIGFRVGITRGWQSTWFANRDFADLLHDDLKIRKFVKERLTHAGVSNVEIERASNRARINIWTSRPGIIIGKRGSEVDKLKAELQQLTGNQVYVNIKEVRKAEMDAQLVAENIGMQLERRIAFRRAMKKSVVSAMRFGAKGVKIQCSGRLGGAEIARTEWYREGRVPLGTLRADIDYGVAEAMSTYGVIGVKVWIFRGEMIRTPRRRPATEVPSGKDS